MKKQLSLVVFSFTLFTAFTFSQTTMVIRGESAKNSTKKDGTIYNLRDSDVQSVDFLSKQQIKIDGRAILIPFTGKLESIKIFQLTSPNERISSIDDDTLSSTIRSGMDIEESKTEFSSYLTQSDLQEIIKWQNHTARTGLDTVTRSNPQLVASYPNINKKIYAAFSEVSTTANPGYITFIASVGVLISIDRVGEWNVLSIKPNNEIIVGALIAYEIQSERIKRYKATEAKNIAIIEKRNAGKVDGNTQKLEVFEEINNGTNEVDKKSALTPVQIFTIIKKSIAKRDEMISSSLAKKAEINETAEQEKMNVARLIQIQKEESDAKAKASQAEIDRKAKEASDAQDKINKDWSQLNFLNLDSEIQGVKNMQDI